MDRGNKYYNIILLSILRGCNTIVVKIILFEIGHASIIYIHINKIQFFSLPFTYHVYKSFKNFAFTKCGCDGLQITSVYNTEDNINNSNRLLLDATVFGYNITNSTHPFII